MKRPTGRSGGSKNDDEDAASGGGKEQTGERCETQAHGPDQWCYRESEGGCIGGVQCARDVACAGDGIGIKGSRIGD